MPFFIGFFAMLQSAPELRFAQFLWVKDLAAPDTVAVLALGSFNLPINILPLILGVTMIVQMRLMPQQQGMADNEQAQMMAKMMKWMPLVYVVFCYSFSCALALYSTINGLFMIGQQFFVNRMKDPEFAAASTPKGAALNAMKNVTPSKKKGR
jgi:YidC/Oxa1 family membrane protein insertase